MINIIWQSLRNEKRPFILFDIFECNICLQLIRLAPGCMQIIYGYKSLKRQVSQPIDGLLLQCSIFLKCCPRPIAQIFGYPLIFAALIYFLCSSFNSHISLLQEEDSQIYLITHIYLVGSMIATYLLTYLISPGHFDSKEDKEELKKAYETKPELKYNQRILCRECNVPRVARSFHCQFCQKCIAKGEYHSAVLNKCIGAGNMPYYFLFLISMVLVFGYQFIILGRFRAIGEKRIGLFYLLLNLKMCIYYVLLLCQHITGICFNLTFKEVFEAKKLPYLWKTLDFQFFNPFDKGLQGNLREFILVISSNKSVPLTQKEISTYLHIDDEEKSAAITDTSRTIERSKFGSDSDSDEEEKKQEEHDEFDEIGKERLVPEKYINWLTKKFYTIVDIPNSPIRDLAIVEMKKKMRKLKAQSNSPEGQFEKEMKRCQSEGVSKEELEAKRKAFLERMNQNREQYMQKQLEIQKKQLKENPMFEQQQKQLVENGIIQALQQAKQYPYTAQMIYTQVAQAEKNYAFLFGDEALAAFKSKQAESISNGNEQNQSAVTSPVPSQYVYKPEEMSNTNIQNSQI